MNGFELPGYDAWKLAASPYLRDEVSIIGKCCICKCDIFEREEHYEINDDIVCEDCDMDYMRKFRKVGA